MTELRPDSGAGDQPPQHPPVPARVDFSTGGGSAARGGEVTASGGRGDTDATMLRSPSDQMGALPRVPGVTLMREIGRGGMGVVYLGKQAFLDRQVAVKLLSDKRQSPEFLARFQREAKILAGLTHEHIVACYQSDITPDGQCFLVMEYIDGPNLLQWVEQNGELGVDDALAICRDLSRALGYADREKIIHRDVKPENVLLSRDNKSPAGAKFPFKAKLTDLGLARPTNDDSTKMNLTLDGAVMGTPASMAPEQFDDPQSVDFRADIYGLGCVLFQALTGAQPFPQRQLTTLIMAKKASPNGPNPRTKKPEIPEAVAQLAMHMLALAPKDRPQSYDEIARRCDQLIGKGPAARAMQPRLKLALGVAALAVVGVGSWLAMRDGELQHDEHATDDAPLIMKVAALVAPLKPAQEGDEVELDGSPSDPDGSLGLTYAWKQLEGTQVELTGANSPRATFRAPQAKQPYSLAFALTTSKESQSVTSATATVHVDASDDAPTVTADPVPALIEGSTVTLLAHATDADGDAIESYSWKQVGGPTVEVSHATSSALTFTTPNAASDYSLEFEVRATGGAKQSAPARVLVSVHATNEPPVITLNTPQSAEAGDRITLAASVTKDAEQIGALGYTWTQLNTDPRVAIEAADTLHAFVIAPEASGDYTLEFQLAVSDAALATATQRAVIAVTCDPKLAPLKRGTTRQWISDAKEFSVEQESAKPADWDSEGATLTFTHDGDGRLIVKSKAGAGALVRDLPRGSFELTGLIESQGAKAKATKACGVRLSYDATHALAICLVSDATGARTLVSFVTESSADGATWSPPANTTLLGPWLEHVALAFTLAWSGDELRVRWGKPDEAARSEHTATLPSRPKQLALFVDTGQCAVFDWKLAGL